MSKTVRLTAAQAVVRWLAAQRIVLNGAEVPYFAGCWAIFGHGNVAAIGEALWAARNELPTYRAHNEQSMAHAAIAYAKQMRRQRAMICTTSIGPGATNMVTAAALAHVNRLPVLFIPGDVYATRRPDPVLQQVEDFNDGAVSANDCFRPVSRFFDRIVRPEQILDALPKIMATFMDPATCGPATLAFCQDVQAEAFDYPVEFFAPRLWHERRQAPDAGELDRLVTAIKQAQRPLVIVGGGVLYSRAERALMRLCEAAGLPFAETQAGKGGIAWDHPNALGAIGVTGSDAANAIASKADLIVGVGTRLQDFTTGSRTLFPDCRLFQINVQAFDAHKHRAEPVVGDARVVLDALFERLQGWTSPGAGTWQRAVAQWNEAANAATAFRQDDARPSDAQVIGAVQRSVSKDAIVVCASGGLPGELHKLWRVAQPGGYHLEYGFSCMGYEIAGGLGVKMAEPDREVVVMVGDGSYMMLNAELATSVMMGQKLIVTVLDNRGYGCIHRLQAATGGAAFNNLLADAHHELLPDLDFAAHARSLGAHAEHVANLGEFAAAMARARTSDRSYVIVIETDPIRATEAGGWWWDVAVPEVSERAEVQRARERYEGAIRGKLK